MENGELVFITTPAMGHLVAEMELAKQVVAHHPTISITVLIPKLPIPDQNLDAYIQSSLTNHQDTNRISLVQLPALDNAPSPSESVSKRPFFLFNLLATLYKPVVKRFVERRRKKTIVLGILTDMLITQMVDVAEELGVPSYILYTSGANLLAMTLQIESLAIDVPSAFGGLPRDSVPLESVLGFKNPVPLMEWPEILFDEENSAEFLLHTARYRQTKGILVNTFAELETELLRALHDNERTPPVYAVGPILRLGRRQEGRDQPALIWLDAQPKGSVVFLCFGSNATFDKPQVEQIALGIERSGCRFLWSLRQKPVSSKGERLPSDYDDFCEVLPDGFLERTAGVGMMIGWAPQTEVLSHQAVGAFVSHCGWNSVLESLWFGVPVVAWPMYAEQHLNSFLLVRELGMAVEMGMDYKYDLRERKGNVVVMADEVEKGIRRMMEEEEGVMVRKKVKEMSEMANEALDVGGSSTKSLYCFTQDLIKNLSMK